MRTKRCHNARHRIFDAAINDLKRIGHEIVRLTDIVYAQKASILSNVSPISKKMPKEITESVAETIKCLSNGLTIMGTFYPTQIISWIDILLAGIPLGTVGKKLILLAKQFNKIANVVADDIERRKKHV